MKKFEEYPKSIKKVVRYIHQDEWEIERLESIQRIINYHINQRKKEIMKQQQT